MKSSHKMLRVLALAALVGVGAFGSAEAATISVSPSAQTVVIGNPVSVDIVATLGVGEALGAFDFNLAFSDLILNGTTVVVDPDGKFQEAPLGFEAGAFGALGVSPLLVNASADPGCDFACLSASQGAGFTLARVTFSTVGVGLSPLTLLNVALGDADGLPMQGFQIANGSVCVTAAGTAGPCVVPEPASLSLLAAGLAAAFVRRRATRRAV
jgi:hypothetical protein